MNRDDIIRMAREAGLSHGTAVLPHSVEYFAALVAAVEREECAREAERFLLMNSGAVWQPAHFCDGIAAAIRARGE